MVNRLPDLGWNPGVIIAGRPSLDDRRNMVGLEDCPGGNIGQVILAAVERCQWRRASLSVCKFRTFVRQAIEQSLDRIEGMDIRFNAERTAFARSRSRGKGLSIHQPGKLTRRAVTSVP
jgi:hypothetical protein